jgi:hypothetical protein
VSNKTVGLTLVEIGEQTGISLPALAKYKKNAESNGLKKFMVGAGRFARFKKSSVPTFVKLRNQGLKKRGRPRKNA